MSARRKYDREAIISRLSEELVKGRLWNDIHRDEGMPGLKMVRRWIETDPALASKASIFDLRERCRTVRNIKKADCKSDVDRKVRIAQLKAARMSGDDFKRWMEEMLSTGRAKTKTEAMLMIGNDQENYYVYIKTGVPYKTALACAAVLAGIGPYAINVPAYMSDKGNDGTL